MRKSYLGFTAAALGLAASAHAVTITYDGVLNEWTGPDVYNLGTQGAPDGGNYTLLATSDASWLYLGVDRDSSNRYLGDDAFNNDSFFVAVDVDGVAGSGASSDGYGAVVFAGQYLPDRIYYYAGGAGWWESSQWNGSGWDWIPWTNANTYYGWQEGNANDELGIALADIGGSPNVQIWAWMTREGGNYVEASWPAGTTGNSPTFAAGIMVPEPATLGLLALGALALAPRRRRA